MYRRRFRVPSFKLNALPEKTKSEIQAVRRSQAAWVLGGGRSAKSRQVHTGSKERSEAFDRYRAGSVPGPRATVSTGTVLARSPTRGIPSTPSTNCSTTFRQRLPIPTSGLAQLDVHHRYRCVLLPTVVEVHFLVPPASTSRAVRRAENSRRRQRDAWLPSRSTRHRL